MVGTDFHPFDRLLDWIDEWLSGPGSGVRCVVQHGTSRAPHHATGETYLGYADLQAAMESADAVVCHGGPATITEARAHGHRPICVPRDPALGEHIDDHQQRFARRLAEAGLVTLAETPAALSAALDEAVSSAPLARRGAASLPSRGTPEAVERIGQLLSALAGTEGATPSTPSTPAGSAGSPEPAWPAVDVVIATRNRPELLREAIGSVLAQDYPGDIRVLVVFDQAEPDLSLGVTDPHRAVTVVTNVRTPGLAGARNSGIQQGDAELLAFCDDDDIWLPGKLRAQVDALRADPGAVLASCGVRVRYGETTTERVLAQDRVELRDLLRSRVMELHPSTFLFRRAAMVNGFGLVAEDIPGSYAEDYELLLRAARAGRIVSAPVVGTEILWHASSFFTARWVTIAEALTWLLERYPEFRAVPRGHARILGQIAFATAAQGERGAAVGHALRAMRASVREPRAYLALAVATRLLSADRVLAVLQRRGQSV
jgi:UDP-N-acetylglucosamine transferase subunit ALG13